MSMTLIKEIIQNFDGKECIMNTLLYRLKEVKSHTYSRDESIMIKYWTL